MKEKDVIYIEGVGYCKEIVVNRYDSNGINTPYVVYEEIKENKGGKVSKIKTTKQWKI